MNVIKVTANDLVPLIVRIAVSNFLEGEIGLVATKPIVAGIIIGYAPPNLEEVLCPWSEFSRLDSGMKMWVDDYCLGNEEGFYLIRNPNHWPIMWSMNHSCDGNIGFDDNGNFIAIRPIKEGEELVYDYGLGESNPHFHLECHCGSENCRGEITGDDWKKLRQDPKVAKYMLPDLR